MPKNIALVGFDLEVLELLEDNSCINIIGYIDKNKIEASELDYLGNDKKFIAKNYTDIDVVLTMDIPEVREKLFYIYKNYIVDFYQHSTAKISKRANVGDGTVIQANTLISSNVKIGRGCFINYFVSVHHESQIGDFTILAPKVMILGRVEIKNKCYIGAGAIIKENVTIGSNVIIGAGSVVINDIESNSIVVGNPAKKYLGK